MANDVSKRKREPDGRWVASENRAELSKLRSELRAKKTKLQSAMFLATEPQDVVDVWEAVKRSAVDGNVTAQALYMAYAAGKPREAVDITVDTEDSRVVFLLPSNGRGDDPPEYVEG